MQKTGAEIFVECLLHEKVDYLFGIPGGSVLPIFDRLYDSPLKFILTRHEQGAAHMADGFARSTGKVGVCLATSGPGAANLTTGLATAYMDSVPVVAFTGQVATNLIGNDAFQEADTTGITRPITKHNFLVKDVNELAITIRQAFYIASTGRPGPVLVDIPVDVQRGIVNDFAMPQKVELKSYKPNVSGHPVQIKKLADAIKHAERPVLYVGGGAVISNAHRELLKLAETCNIPVTTTLMAIGVFPSDSELNIGMLGMHGMYWANHAMQNADLIIAVGARFDDRCTGKLTTFAPKAKTIAHIDIDPTSISKNVPTQIPVVGDIKNVLTDLLKHVKPKKHTDWLKQIDKWRKEKPLTYPDDNKLRPQFVVEKITELTRGGAIVATEVGQNQMWAAQYYKPRHPRYFLSSGGLGTMGYGFPAAIGAKFGNPGKTVIDIAGDGSFQMNIQELATAVVNKVNVVVCILNNSYLGLVRQWQQMFYKNRYSAVQLCTQPNKPGACGVPDFVKVAQAYGAEGYRVVKKKDVVPTLIKALKVRGKPVILDFVVEQEENVLPMVPAGASLDEIITSLV